MTTRAKAETREPVATKGGRKKPPAATQALKKDGPKMRALQEAARALEVPKLPKAKALLREAVAAKLGSVIPDTDDDLARAVAIRVVDLEEAKLRDELRKKEPEPRMNIVETAAAARYAPGEEGDRPTPRKPRKPAKMPRAIEISLDELPDLAPEPTTRFWCGTFADSPVQNVTRGGVEFQLFEGVVNFDEAGNAKGQPRLGKILELTEQQIELIKIRVGDVVIRGINTRAIFVHRTAKAFRKEPGDVALGHFLYMVELGELMPPAWRGFDLAKAWPPAMVRRRKAAEAAA